MLDRLKTLLALTFLSIAPVAHAQQAVDIEAFALKFIEAEKAAWEKGDFEALEALEHADVMFQNINGTVFRGWEAHKQAIEDAKASYNAPLTQEWRYLMGDGNIFAVAYEWTIHSTDQPLVIAGIAVGRVEDGRLKEEWGAGYTVAPGP